MLREFHKETQTLENGIIETKLIDNAGNIRNTITLTPVKTISTKQIAEEIRESIEVQGISKESIPYYIEKTLESYENNERLLKIYGAEQKVYRTDASYIDLPRHQFYNIPNLNFKKELYELELGNSSIDELDRLFYNSKNVPILEWVQHEKWKTGKLVQEVPKRALGMIKKKLLTSLPTEKYDIDSDNKTQTLKLTSPTRFLTLLAKYLTATDANLFSDTFRLLATGIFDKESPALVRAHLGNVAKVKVYDEDNPGKSRIIPAMDNRNECLSRATYKMLRQISFLIYSAACQVKSYTTDFLYHNFLTQDEENARIIAEKLVSDSHLVERNFDYDFRTIYPYLDTFESGGRTYLNIKDLIVNAEEDYTEHMEQARIYYLRGRLALLTEAIAKGYCKPDVLITKDGIVQENKTYADIERNRYILKVFRDMLESSGFNLSHNQSFSKVLDRISMVATMFTKNESLNQNLFYDNIQLNQIHTVGRNKVKVMNVRFYQQSYTSLTEPACKEWLKSVEDIYRFVLDLSHIMCNSKPASKPPTGQASENIQGF